MESLPQCVVFDFDGTLVDSNALKRAAFFEVLAGSVASADQVAAVLADLPRADRLGIIEETLRRVRSGPPDSAVIQELATSYNHICEAGAVACAEMPGATDLLQTLGRTVPLHLNSATPEEPLLRIIAGRRWTEFFASICGRPTSKLDNLRRISRATGAPAERMVLVGDQDEDARAAREFGCPFVAVGSFARADWPSVPHLASLAALPNWLADGLWRSGPFAA